MKKKVISIFLAAAVLTGLMWGCGREEAPESSQTTGSTAETITGTGDEGSVTGVTFIWGGTADTYDEKAVEEEDRINAEYTQRTGNVRQNMAFSYDSRFIWAQIEGDALPTVFIVPYDDAQTLIKNASSRNIQKLLDERGWTRDLWNSELVEFVSDENGDMHGLPYSISGRALLCNVNVMEEAGMLDENGNPICPETWEDLVDMAIAIRQKTGKNGLAMCCNDRQGAKDFINITWNYGAELYVINEDGTYTSQLNHPGVVTATELFRELVQNDAINGNVFMNQSADCIRSVAVGESAMCFSDGELPTEYEPDANMDDFVILPLPEGPDGNEILAGGYCYWFDPNATDDEIRAVLDFIEMYGASPVWNEDQYTVACAEAEAQIEEYGRYLPQTNVFTEAYQKDYQKVLDQYDEYVEDQYWAYYEACSDPARLRLELSEQLDMYRFLLTAVQELSVNPKADIQEYLDTSSANFQEVLILDGLA